MRSLFLLFIFLTSFASASPLLKSKRILFLGDSITYSGIHLANLETYLTLAHPDPERIILNLGLPSETVSGLSEEGHANGKFPRPDLAERIVRVLSAVKPDHIIVSYGINCGIYQPFDAVRFRKYREGIIALRNQAARFGAQITFMTPWPYDAKINNPDIPQDYNTAVLGRYSQWLLDQRIYGWQVIDIHGPMTKALAQQRKTKPDLAFTRDGIHHNSEGEWVATTLLLNRLGGGNPPSLEAMLAPYPNGKETHKKITERMKKLRDEWLTKTRHERPGTPGGPDKR